MKKSKKPGKHRLIIYFAVCEHGKNGLDYRLAPTARRSKAVIEEERREGFQSSASEVYCAHCGPDANLAYYEMFADVELPKLAPTKVIQLETAAQEVSDA